jgi:hypothetical protein
MKLDSLRHLLFAGADTELEDNTGRTVSVLILLYGLDLFFTGPRFSPYSFIQHTSDGHNVLSQGGA